MNQIPESFDTLLEMMTPEMHQQLKTAVELGRWENGEKLTTNQRELCLQAVIAYDTAFLSPELRTGYLGEPDNPCSKKQTSAGKRPISDG